MCLLAMTRILLLAMAILPLVYTGVRRTPAAAAHLQRSFPHPTAATSLPSQPSTLDTLIAQYEHEPTPEAAAAVWSAFSSIGDKIAALKERVSATTGGVRAEAEVERIQLEHSYDQQLARFAAVHARLQAAHDAFDALTAATDAASGIRAATTALVHGASPLVHGRVTGRDHTGWTPEKWDLQ